MRINLLVTFEDKTTKDVVCNAADLVAFEEKFNISVSAIGAETKLSHLLYLAWHSEKRTKGTTQDFNGWLETVDSIGDSGNDPK
jgi:predicted SAM-dependent methyltransferase